MNEVLKIIKNVERRIEIAKEDIKDAQSDIQYERAKGALYELEELLNDIMSEYN